MEPLSNLKMTPLPSSFNIPHLHIIVIFCHFFGVFSSLPHNLGQHNFLSPDASKSQLSRLEFFCFCVDRKHEIQSGICNKSVLTLCCNLYMLFAFFFLNVLVQVVLIYFGCTIIIQLTLVLYTT